jgi:hypothetical protein
MGGVGKPYSRPTMKERRGGRGGGLILRMATRPSLKKNHIESDLLLIVVKNTPKR